jgi:hypothetical protein
MMAGKYRMSQIIEALAACFALIALPTVLLVVPSPLYDVLALAVSTFNLRSPSQPPYRLVATIVVYQVLDVQFHAGTRRLTSASFDASAFLWFKTPKPILSQYFIRLDFADKRLPVNYSVNI